MGMFKKVTLNNGLVSENAYIRIDNTLLFKGVRQFEMTVNYFTKKPVFDPETNTTDIQPFEQLTYKIYNDEYDELFGVPRLKQTDVDPFKAGYLYLKTLSDYQDATDDL